MVKVPSGTVTFLFTDVEGSTRLWETYPEAMRVVLARHDALLRRAVEAHDGYVVKSTGDGCLAAFSTANDAVGAARDAQVALGSESWGEIGALKVRMGVHSGAAQFREGDYYGSVLNRAARLTAIAHGGQVLVSETTGRLVDPVPDGVEMVDLGEHRLRDLTAPMRVFQLRAAGLAGEFPPLRSIEARSGNLPDQLTSFIGREADAARASKLLSECRLMTLTGVGGVGKTRLALQVAADVLPTFSGGAWFVELARTGDPSAVATIALAAVGIPAQRRRRDVDVLCQSLRTTRALVVLDNCEHVLDAAADLVGALLEHCPHVVVLATSREPLDVPGEQILPVRPLDPTGEAVSLFCERAGRADPNFELDVEPVSVVERICARLDGVPLAVELAAARVDAFSLADIEARLDDRFRLLASGRRRAFDRHQTLRATLEWSHQLLDDDECVLFRRLGVFAGGFSASAAQEVCATPCETLDVEELLASLVRKSLVNFDRDPRPGRYRLLEMVRVFALERLADANEAEQFGRAHAEWVASLIGHSIEAWFTEADIDRAVVVRELDNWREAVNYALAGTDPALIMSLTLHNMGADFPELTRWTEAALANEEVTQLPGAHCLHWAVAIPAAASMDLDAIKVHADAFEAGCANPTDKVWCAPPRAVEAILRGNDPVPVIEAALEMPQLSPLQTAYLHLFRGLYRNMPPNLDPAAARTALALCTEAHLAQPAVPHVFLAIALREEDPDEAIQQLNTAEELIRVGSEPFAETTVAAWGSIVLLALPDGLAARHLLTRLDRLQAHWNTNAAALLTTCAAVLGRTNMEAAALLSGFLAKSPGGSQVLTMIAPGLAENATTNRSPDQLDDAVSIARSALDQLADDHGVLHPGNPRA